MKSVLRFKIAAMIVLGVMIAYWLIQATIALLSGQAAALSMVLHMLAIGLLAVLSWKWPLPGGILTVLWGAAVAMYYLLVLFSLAQAAAPLLFISAPMGISGLLLIEADWLARKARGPGES